MCIVLFTWMKTLTTKMANKETSQNNDIGVNTYFLPQFNTGKPQIG
jgi:hypothetical protein